MVLPYFLTPCIVSCCSRMAPQAWWEWKPEKWAKRQWCHTNIWLQPGCGCSVDTIVEEKIVTWHHLSSRRHPCSKGRFLSWYSHHLFCFMLHHLSLKQEEKGRGERSSESCMSPSPLSPYRHRHCDTARAKVGSCAHEPNHHLCLVTSWDKKGQGGGGRQRWGRSWHSGQQGVPTQPGHHEQLPGRLETGGPSHGTFPPAFRGAHPLTLHQSSTRSSPLVSCLKIFLCTPNLAKGTCWNGAMLLVL